MRNVLLMPIFICFVMSCAVVGTPFNSAPHAYKYNSSLTDAEASKIQVYIEPYEGTILDKNKDIKFYYKENLSSTEVKDVSYGQGTITRVATDRTNFVTLKTGTPGVIVNRSYGSVEVDFGNGLILTFVPTNHTWGNAFCLRGGSINGTQLVYDNNEGASYYLRSVEDIHYQTIRNKESTTVRAEGKLVK